MGDYNRLMPGVSGPGGVFGGLLMAGIIVVVGGIQALVLYGGGELVHLLIAPEHNTRTTAQLLRGQP